MTSKIFYKPSYYHLTICVSLIFLMMLSGSSKAQSDTIRTIFLEQIKDQRILDHGWLYHKGNNPEWANPDFSDAEWDTLATTLNLDQVDKSLFNGAGWFRLHIEVDSSLYNKTLLLTMDQMGASEVYFNGEKIKTIGQFATDSTREKRENLRLIPIEIQFTSQQYQLLAVRYGHEKAWKYKQRYGHAEIGFTASFKSFERAMTELTYFITSNYSLLGLMMSFLILGAIHLLIYFFYRKRIANLYYSIFMFLFSFIVYGAKMELAISINPDWFILTRYLISIIIPFFFISLLGFTYSLFHPKMPKFFWIILASGILISIGNSQNFDFVNYALFVYALIVPIEVMRALIRALFQKADGAWIIGSGVLFFILFLMLIVLVAVLKGNIQLNSSDPLQLVLLIFILLAIISIPLSMSVYLARDIAKTNLNLEKQLDQVTFLSAKTLEQEREKKKILEEQKDMLERQVRERTRELSEEKTKTEELLLNTLPLKVVNDLKENGITEPESFDDVTVFFSDIVGFTKLSAELDPHRLISELNQIFTAFDDIMVKNQCERIKTVGDAYLAVCGMPERNENHAEHMIRAALEIVEFLQDRNASSEIHWEIRIGIHSGRVIGGIVGIRKYIYDVFGDTINTTSRMESSSRPMAINVSESTFRMVKDKFEFTPGRLVEVKGKGKLRMYFIRSTIQK